MQSAVMLPDLEHRTVAIGRELLAQLGSGGGGGWSDRLLESIMDDEAFRVQALRFVDVLPALEDNAELVRHLREYFGDQELPLPGLLSFGLRAATGATGKLLAPAVRKAISHVARRFIGGA